VLQKQKFMHKYSQIKYEIHLNVFTYKMQNGFREQYIIALKLRNISVDPLDFSRKEKISINRV
jgi:hypothetical protein